MAQNACQQVVRSTDQLLVRATYRVMTGAGGEWQHTLERQGRAARQGRLPERRGLRAM